MRTEYECSCVEESVVGMPEMGLEIALLGDYFKLNSKEYFTYPYYNNVTLPDKCHLQLSEAQGKDIKQYVFGQIFVRKYQLYLEY